MKRRILAALLSVCLLLGLATPSTVYAADASGDTTDGQTVYIYLLVANNTKNWAQTNKHGWVTVGTVKVPGLTSASGVDHKNYFGADDATQKLVVDYLKSDGQNGATKISFYSDNEKQIKEYLHLIDLNGIVPAGGDETSKGLKVDEGATDYDVSGNTWHLDTYIDMSLYGRVTVRYHKDGATTDQITIEEVGTEVTPSDAKYADYYKEVGYRLVAAKADSSDITLDTTTTVEQQSDHVVDLYYEPVGTVAISDWTYDGTAAASDKHPVTGLLGTAEAKPDEYRWMDAEGNVLTEAPVDAGTYQVVGIWKGQAVDGGDIQSEAVTFTIGKRDAVVKSGDAKKVYDGTELKNETVTAEGFLDGEGLDAAASKATGSITDVGKKDNDFTYALNGATKRENYNITETKGVLEITPASANESFNVTKPEDVKYDGKDHAQEPKVTDKNGNELEKGRDYELSYTEDVKNAGEVTVTVTGKGNYEGSVDVKYTIKKRTITLTSESAKKTYDGSPLTRPDVTETGDGFAEGEGYTETGSPKAVGTVTAVGKVSNEITYEVTEGTDLDRNYTFTVAPGQLEVEEADISDQNNYEVTAPNDVPYNGESQQEKPTVKDKKGNTLTEGNDYDLIYSEDTTNVGTVTVTIKGKSPNFKGTTDVTYRITPVGLKADPLPDVQYNGTNQAQKPKVTDASGKELTEGTDYELSYSEDVKNAGEVTVTVTGKGNYEGSAEVKYNITKRNIHLKSEGGSKPYDGTPLTKPDVTETGDGFADGEGFETCKATGSVTTVDGGEVENKISYTLKKGTKKENYNITTETDTLKIEAETTGNLEILPPSDTDYNGESQKEKPTVKDKEGNLLTEGRDYDLIYSDDTTNVGTVTVTVKGKGPNYTGETDVTYQIKPVDLKASAPEDVLYNGKDQAEKPKVTDKAGKELREGVDYTLSYTEDVKNAGDVTVTVTGKGNYQGTEDVSYKIKKRTITLTSESAKKTYNGSPLTRPGVTETGDGFADGEGYTEDGAPTATGTITDVGETENTISYEVTENTDLEKNYEVIENPGKLEVVEADISSEENYEITAPSDVDYNGESQKQSPTVMDKDGNVLTEGTDYDLIYSEDTTNVGTVTVTIQGKGPNFTGTTDVTYRILPVGLEAEKLPDVLYNGKEQAQKPKVTDKDGKELTEGVDYDLSYSGDVKNVGEVTVTVTGKGNYSGTADVTYKIRKRSLILTSESGNKAYDGKPLTKPDVTVEGDGFAEGEQFSKCGAVGSVTEVGSIENEIVYALADGVNADNYDITVKTGILTVTPVIKPEQGPHTGVEDRLAWNLTWMLAAGLGMVLVLTRKKKRA